MRSYFLIKIEKHDSWQQLSGKYMSVQGLSSIEHPKSEEFESDDFC